MRSPALAALAAIFGAGTAHAAVSFFATPAGLEGFVGGPLLPVPDDGMPVGTIYGMGGIPLPTPIGPMSFLPGHDKVAPGTYHPAFPGPLAGSDVVAPAGTTAIDFLFTPLVPGSFSFTGIGSASGTPPMVLAGLAPGVPVYVGFGAVGETIDFVAIATVPFSTPPMTWHISEIRVIPTPGASAIGAFALPMYGRRRRRMR